ncbi:MAG: ABC transporter permease [Clostridiales bacterium]|nr:ABC transporter permease [Clostridiales bacterium]
MFLRLLRAELKQALKNAPYLLVAFAVLGLICGGFVLTGAKSLYSKTDSKITIALYYPEDEASDLMIAAIEKMDSAKQNLEIKRVEENEVLPMVENGEAYGGVIIPDDFVKDIITGKNTPATVYLPQSNSVDSLLVRSYLSAGIGDLAAAQAAIYALLECFGYGSDKTDLININLVYLNAAFTREDIFKDITFSASGSLSTLQYYAVRGFIIFLMLFGSLFSGVGLSSEGAVGSRLKAFGISAYKQWLISLIVRLILYGAISAVIVSAAFLLPESLNLAPEISLQFIISLLSVIIFCGIFSSGVLSLFGVWGSLVIFISTLIFSLLSGAILPVSFLPERVQAVAPYMPVKALAEALSSVYGSETGSTGLIVPIAAFLLISIIILIKDRLN